MCFLPVYPQAGDSRRNKISTSSSIPAPTSASPTPGPSHSHASSSTHQPPSTYDNILKTLALLEEAPPPLAKPKSDNSPHSHLDQSGYYLSVDNVNKLDSLSTRNPSLNGMGMGVADPALLTGTANASSGGLSESKLQSILSYLDEMDKADQNLLSEISKTRSRAKTEALPTPRTASVTMKSNKASEKTKRKPTATSGDNKEKEK